MEVSPFGVCSAGSWPAPSTLGYLMYSTSWVESQGSLLELSPELDFHFA